MKCFVCGKENGRLTRFSDASFQKCINLLAFRKLKKFKYREADLTYESKFNAGYHVKCYKLFAVLKRKYKAEFDSLLSPKANSPPRESYPFLQDNHPDNFEPFYFDYMPEKLQMSSPESERYQTGNKSSRVPQESKQAKIKQPSPSPSTESNDRNNFQERKPKNNLYESSRRQYFTRKRPGITENIKISNNDKNDRNYEPTELPYQIQKRRRGRPRKNPKKELDVNQSISSSQAPSDLQISEEHKEDDADVFAKGVAVKLRKLASEDLKIIVQRDIDMLLYDAIIGTGRYSYSTIEREFTNSYPVGGLESNGYLESTVKVEETELLF